jgi:Bacterial archaeo-eukaryotic release factor family 3
MDVIHRQDLQRLATRGGGPCVSLYLPTHRAGRQVEQAPIRLKNLLQEARAALGADGVRAPQIDGLLEPFRRLLDNALFWQHQSDGLALFSRPEWWRSLRVPLRLLELAVVGDRFHVTPLLPLLAGDGHFFVLALSQNEIRLLEGTRERLEEVELSDVPPGPQQSRRDSYPGAQLQAYVADRGGVGAQAAFHGHGLGGEVRKEQILQYFHKVDEALRDVLADERAPMVLAAVEHLAPIYRKANTYPNLVDEALTGSPEGLRPDELHQRAWPIVEPLFQRAQREAVERYAQLAGTGLTSPNLEEIAAAADTGRIETLFISRSTGAAGGAGAAVPGRGEDAPTRDLLEWTVVAALSKGGTVYMLPAGEVPGGGHVGAVFRY